MSPVTDINIAGNDQYWQCTVPPRRRHHNRNNKPILIFRKFVKTLLRWEQVLLSKLYSTGIRKLTLH
eukprot:2418339-Ditylum_brightwellii.AAC.1